MAQKTQAQTQQQKIESLLGKLTPSTKKKLAAFIANSQRLKGKDITTSMVSTFGNILKDLGVLNKVAPRSEINNALGIFDLGANWDKQSDIQKFINTGKQIVKLSSQYADQDIPYAGNTLGLAAMGYAQYQLLNNWGNLNDVQKLVGIAHTISNAGNAYNAFSNISNAAKAIDSGVQATTSVARATSAAEAGLSAGVGAEGAAAASTLNTALQAAGWVAAAYGAYQMVTDFGEGGPGGRASGATSGAALGTAIMPGIGTAIGAIVGLGVGSVKTGKSVEQQARDSYRGFFNEVGVFQKEGNSFAAKLADGSIYDVGVDGSDGRAFYQGNVKTFADKNKVLKRDQGQVLENGEVRPYDVDYTNDLDFFASHGLRGLQYIIGGGNQRGKESTEYNQMFGYMANAATSNASSRKFSKDNFNTSMRNIRNFYSQAGVTNSDQAYNLLTQLRTENKISEQEMQEAMQGIRIAFNNDYDYANQLNSTRFDGLDTVSKDENFVDSGEPLEGIRRPIAQPVRDVREIETPGIQVEVTQPREIFTGDVNLDREFPTTVERIPQFDVTKGSPQTPVEIPRIENINRRDFGTA